MTERELFYKMLPEIAEMVVECRKMSVDEYEDWKCMV